MNPCVNTERQCNESNNESEQIMILTNPIHVYLIIFLIHYFVCWSQAKALIMNR